LELGKSRGEDGRRDSNKERKRSFSGAALAARPLRDRGR
jgi:hypothetical protein